MSRVYILKCQLNKKPYVVDNKCLRVAVLDKCHVLGKTNGLESLGKSVHTQYKVKIE